MANASSKIPSVAREHTSTTADHAAVHQRPRVRACTIAIAWPLLIVVHTSDLAALPARSRAAGAAMTGRPQIRPIMRVAQSEANISVENLSGVSGEPLRLKIALAEDVLRDAKNASGPVFMMFRGVPAKFSFSAGFRVNEAWAVSLKDLPQLTLLAPQDFSGTLNLTATLHLGKEATSLLYAYKVTFVSASEAASATRQVTAPLPNVVFGSPETEKAALPVTQEAELLARGASLFKSGDFVSARLIYGELAGRGSRVAALRMAETYDPEILKSFLMVGIKPSLDKARHWYTRAMELGAIEARDRLKVLGNAEAR